MSSVVGILKLVGGGSSAAIPANVRKVVQELKEIVRNSDDEIYAMLQECGMDPDETAQKLLAQDTFHEVRRKRDKRKEVVDAKVAVEARFPTSRGGRGGTGRARRGGNFLQRFSSTEASDSWVQPLPARENGAFSGPSRGGHHMALSASRSYYKPKVVSTGNSSGVAPSLSSSSVEVSNGSTAMASGTAVSPLGVPDSITNLNSPSLSSPGPPADGGPAVAAIVEDSPKLVGDDKAVVPPPAKAAEEGGSGSLSSSLRVSKADDRDGSSLRAPEREGSLPHLEYVNDIKPNKPSSSLPHQSSSGRRGATGPQYGSRAVFQPYSTGPQKANSGLEWKPKSLASKSTASESIIVETSSMGKEVHLTQHSDITSAVAASPPKLQEDPLVIIPDHLRVPVSEMNGLCFGSFGEDIATSVTPESSSEDNGQGSPLSEDSYSNKEPNASSIIDDDALPLSSDQNVHAQPSPSDSMAALPTSDDGSGTSEFVPTAAPPMASSSQEGEARDSEPSPIPDAEYAYAPIEPGYHGMGVTQSSSISYEAVGSQASHVSKLPNYVPYSEPASFFGNTRFNNQAPSTNAASKYAVQSLRSSLEVGGPMVLPGSIMGRSMPAGAGGLTPSTLAMSHLPLPLHAYPPPAQHGGVPFSPFAAASFGGYQYVPASYTYMQPPYQPSGSSYAPAGSGYSPAATGITYTSSGAALKYAFPAQFKLPNVIGGAPPSAAYGSYDEAGGLPSYKDGNLYATSQQQQQAEGAAALLMQGPPLSRDVQSGNSFYNLPLGHAAGYAHSPPPIAYGGPLYHHSPNAAPTAHTLLQQSQAGAYQQAQRAQLNWGNNY